MLQGVAKKKIQMIDGQTDGHTYRQIERQADRQVDVYLSIDIHKHISGHFSKTPDGPAQGSGDVFQAMW